MVVGASGVGKSAFIELFLKKFNYREASKVMNKISKHNAIKRDIDKYEVT